MLANYSHLCCCWVTSVMSDSVWPHRQQPTRMPRPWDSPDKNTGVGCHFLLQCMKVNSESEVAQWCLTLSNPMDGSLPGSSGHGIFQARVLEWGAIAFSSSQLLQILYLPNISMRANFILISHISSQVNPEDSGIRIAHSYVCTSSWKVFQLTYLTEIWEGWIGNTLRENKVMHINQFRAAKWALFCFKNIS